MEGWIKKGVLGQLAILMVCLFTGCGGGGGGTSATSSTTEPISCANAGAGSAVLSWNLPATDTEGAPIALAGFRIFCKTVGGNFEWIASAGALDTTLLLENLVSGMLTFAVTAISTNGVESDYSNFQNKLIQ
jgi:hypothetical protein